MWINANEILLIVRDISMVSEAAGQLVESQCGNQDDDVDMDVDVGVGECK